MPRAERDGWREFHIPALVETRVVLCRIGFVMREGRVELFVILAVLW